MPDAPVDIALVTADQRRHAWFARQLAGDARLRLVGVVREAKRPSARGENEDQDRLITEHLAARDEAEARYFAGTAAIDELDVPVLDVAWGHSNDTSAAEWVARTQPGRLILFGSSIIREPLLRQFDAATINVHLGLSPYYRGTASNFWPLVNGEPECVGATIHLATLSVDAGPIIRQVRPEMEPDDGVHDIGCRALIAGTGVMREAICSHAAGRAALTPQRDGGRLYRATDFHAGAVQELRERFAGGLIPTYLADKARRDQAFPIVE